MDLTLHPVILCGGSGTRLWPLSREMFPKQLLALTNEFSLLQNTVQRLKPLTAAPALFICNENHRFLVAEQLRQISEEAHRILLEPAGRNTAPAVALAALQVQQQNGDGILLVLPSDHVIAKGDAFVTAVQQAVTQAQSGKLVTFGIVPTQPETGYGYIRRGAAINGDVSAVAQFVEKPALETAKAYVASGEYLWNSGMFVFRASDYLKELEQHRPDILAACRAAMAVQNKDHDFIRIDAAAFKACPEDSIDYAVMEKTANAAVVSLDAGWSDIGSFAALWEESEKDAQGNATKGDVMLEGASNCYVNAEGRLVAVIGAEDLVVVETADAVLVARRDAVQDVKKIVASLKKQGREETNTHRRVYRPWGYYEGIDNGERYQVKRIGVNPGASLSLQMHYHRAEHWIVVNGTAEVTCEDKTFLVTENQSTYIPLGHKHRLKNPGKIPLEMIEVQSGTYLGEDDIVRFEDTYGRA